MKQKKYKVGSIFFSIPLYAGLDIMVIVGARNKEDVLKKFKHWKIDPGVTKRWLEEPLLDELLKQEAGSILFKDKLEIIYFFREWKDTPYFQKVLVHEVSHMVDTIAKNKNFVEETEARAYLSEYLFDTIRKSL